MGIKNLITLLSFLFVLFSCEKEEFEPEINQRTTFMYFPWSEDLIDYFYNNISDMEYAIKETGLKNERVIVFLSTSPIKAQMFEIILSKWKLYPFHFERIRKSPIYHRTCINRYSQWYEDSCPGQVLFHDYRLPWYGMAAC